RLPPPGSCNQNANPPGTTDKIIPVTKLILFVPAAALRAASYEQPLNRLLEARSFPATGIVFFYGRKSYSVQARTGDAAPRFRSERHRKKRTLFPSSIECRMARKVSRTPRRIYTREMPAGTSPARIHART